MANFNELNKALETRELTTEEMALIDQAKAVAIEEWRAACAKLKKQ